MNVFNFFNDISDKSSFDASEPLDRYGVLIVDDSRFSRDILRDILESEGIEVVGEASNGQEAISKAQKLRPEIIFLDVEMPVLNGIDALPRILDLDPDIYVIMCSALGQKKIMMDATKAGARDYVIKPFRKENITDVLALYQSAMIEDETSDEDQEVLQEENYNTELIEEDNPDSEKYKNVDSVVLDIDNDVLDSDNDTDKNIDIDMVIDLYTDKVIDRDSLISYKDFVNGQHKYDEVYNIFGQTDLDDGLEVDDLEAELDEFETTDEDSVNEAEIDELELHVEDTSESQVEETDQDIEEALESSKDNSSRELIYIGMMKAYSDRYIHDEVIKHSPSLKLSITNSSDRSFIRDIFDAEPESDELSITGFLSGFDIAKYIVSPDDKKVHSTELNNHEEEDL
ncbi:MAG: response regulator [Clostridiales bacterium]|nr:response regulator [Clostridiales bacterium]